MFCGVATVVVNDQSVIRLRYILRNIDWLLSVGNIIWLLRVIAYQSMKRYIEWAQSQKQKTKNEVQNVTLEILTTKLPERWLHLISVSGYIYKFFCPTLVNTQETTLVQLKKYTCVQATCWTVDWSVAIILGENE